MPTDFSVQRVTCMLLFSQQVMSDTLRPHGL